MSNFSGDDILRLIPQRQPIVMIDGLLESDKDKAISSFLIKSDNIFCENGKFMEAGLIENIAQTAAARMGLICLEENNKVRNGFIGAIKNFKLYYLPDSNTEIITRIDVVGDIMNALIIFGKVEQNGEIVAECEMKIFLSEE